MAQTPFSLFAFSFSLHDRIALDKENKAFALSRSWFNEILQIKKAGREKALVVTP